MQHRHQDRTSHTGLLEALRASKPSAPAAQRIEIDAVNHRARCFLCGNHNCLEHATEWVTIEPWPQPYSRQARAIAWQLQRRFEMHHHHIVDALAAADRVAA